MLSDCVSLSIIFQTFCGCFLSLNAHIKFAATSVLYDFNVRRLLSFLKKMLQHEKRVESKKEINYSSEQFKLLVTANLENKITAKDIHLASATDDKYILKKF